MRKSRAKPPRYCSKCPGKISPTNRKGVCATCQANATCIDCGTKVSSLSTGRCRPCANTILNATPAKREASANAMRAVYADTVQREARAVRQREIVARLMADPVHVERMREVGRTSGVKNLPAGRTPEAREKARVAIKATRLAHIPREYWTLYGALRNSVSAAEATRMVMEQRAKDQANAGKVIERNLQAMRDRYAREQAEAY